MLLRRLFTYLLNSWEQVLALHYCYSLGFTSPVYKMQTGWPLFGCFHNYRVNISRLYVIVLKSFFIESMAAYQAITIVHKRPLAIHKVKMSTFLQLQTHLSWFTCYICVMDAVLTFSYRDELWYLRCPPLELWKARSPHQPCTKRFTAWKLSHVHQIDRH